MTRGFEDVETDLAQCEGLAVVKGPKGIVGLRASPQANGRANAFTQLQMASEKIGMKMGEKGIANVETELGGVLKVLIDVTLRIHDGRDAGRFIRDQIRGMGQTAKIILL